MFSIRRGSKNNLITLSNKIDMENSAANMFEFLEKLWPMHRTLNCDDMELAINMCGSYLDSEHFKIHKYKPKTDVFTWWVPERYHVNEAWLEIEGERIADFSINPLHLLSYSLPKIINAKLGDIKNHLWSNPKLPDAIPWEFKYYERDWGFCVRHNDLIKYSDDAQVKGVIDVEFTDDDFVLAEYYLPGKEDIDLMFLTNICHPAQVNDSLSGLVVGLEMARLLENRSENRYGFRLLIVPETIGTLAWFAANKDKVDKTKYAWFCEMVGHDNSFILQESRQSDSLIDKAFMSVLPEYRKHGKERSGKFREVVASDEMVSNGPGFDIPTPSLTRWPYPEYHTSDDNPDIIDKNNLSETLNVMIDMWDAIENNYYPRRCFSGPVMLSRYDLWVDWRVDKELNLKTEQLMFMLEGNLSVLDIADSLELPLKTVSKYLDKFYEAGLIDKKTRAWDCI